ncbi:MAG: hypothetical protein ACK40T_09275 [Akkermansiaceae bacterium]|jgi:hypothetical protein
MSALLISPHLIFLKSRSLELSEKIRDLAADLKLKTAGTIFATEADHLASAV